MIENHPCLILLGAPGLPGLGGQKGMFSHVKRGRQTIIHCIIVGDTGFNGLPGSKGQPGLPGLNGPPGLNGKEKLLNFF